MIYFYSYISNKSSEFISLDTCILFIWELVVYTCVHPSKWHSKQFVFLVYLLMYFEFILHFIILILAHLKMTAVCYFIWLRWVMRLLGLFFFIVSQKLDWVNQFDMKYADNKWYRFIEFYFLYQKRELKRQRGMHFLDYEEILFGSNVTKCEFTLSIMKFIQTITLYQWFGYSRGRVLDDPFYFVQLPQFY